jgi:hypothetical protein
MSASYTIAVTETPLLISKLPFGIPATTVYLTNQSGNHDLFIGGPDVAENNGFLITKQQSSGISYRAEFVMYAGQELYACARAGATGSIHVGYSA